MSLLEVSSLEKNFSQFPALRGVSCRFEEGEQYVLKGASGSGKSTFLHLIGGLDRPSAGAINYKGQNLADLNDEQLALFRNREVGFVFQFHFLLPSMNCIDNILLPAKIGGANLSKVKKGAASLAEELGVQHCLKKYPFQISGGEQQRISVIRALSLRPNLILCDEPTGSLDSENTEKVTRILQKLAQRQGSTLIVVTHDPSVASQFPYSLELRDGLLIN